MSDSPSASPSLPPALPPVLDTPASAPLAPTPESAPPTLTPPAAAPVSPVLTPEPVPVPPVSPTPTLEPTPPVPTPAPAAEPPAALSDAWLVPRSWVVVVSVLAAAGLVSSGLLWQKLDTIQQELARRATDSSAQSIEARTLAREAQVIAREMSGRLSQQETRLSEVSLQRGQLEELIQSLSRSRDENLVVDIESALRLAQQQAQLTGSVEPLLAALKSADVRVTRALQPRLNPLQRAISQDIDRIKSASVIDVPALMLRLDELARLADDLPMANAMIGGNDPLAASPASAPAAPPVAKLAPPRSAASAPEKSWLPSLSFDTQPLRDLSQRVLGGIWAEARQLLRVSRIAQPEAGLLAPEQAFFLRENLKLRLLNARLALLSRQTDQARSDLAHASVWLNRYFDPTSRRTQVAAQLTEQVLGQLKTSELPRLDATMAALTTAAAGR